jgi:hypothetical protein
MHSMKNVLLLVVACASMLAIVGWSGLGQKRPAWEYKGFSLFMRGTNPEIIEGGKVVPGATTGTKAAEYGNEGWELVAVSANGDVTAYWFKRPK